MPEDWIDPPEDEVWGYDYQDDEIIVGDEIVKIDGEYVPLEKAVDYLAEYGEKVDTEEKFNDYTE